MDRALKVAAIVVLGALGIVYVAAKIHFFTRFDGDVSAYTFVHWPFWAGMAGIGIFGWAVAFLAQRHARDAASKRAVQQRDAADEVRAGHENRGPRS